MTLIAILAGFVAALPRAEASDHGSDQEQITMNFQNVDISILAKFISEITGKNLIIDESVRGKVSIISPAKVTADEAYTIFQSVLELKGFNTVQAGKVIKIVPARNARSEGLLTASQQPFELHGDEFVTRMVHLRNVDAASLVSVIQPMVSHDGLVAAFPQDNAIIITDGAYNVQRLLTILGSLDVRGQQESVVDIPLRYAFAGEIAPEIEQIMGVGGQNGVAGQSRAPGLAPTPTEDALPIKVIPDERTNSLIVLAGPFQRQQIESIIARLDIIPLNATSRIHVYRLRNAQALELTDVLNNLMNGGGSPSSLSPSTGKNSLGRGGFNNSAFGGSSSFGNSSFGGNSMVGSNGNGFGSSGLGGIGTGLGSRAGSSSSNSGSVSASSAGGRGTLFNSPVSVTADPATNALVISASPQDWPTLRDIVAQLDVPTVQVFVQAIIVEVSLEHVRQLGVEFQNYSSSVPFGSLNFGNLQTALTNPLSLTGLNLGIASGKQCSIPTSSSSSSSSTSSSTSTSSTVNVPCDIALIHALETDTHANVLSAPTLLTAANEEATIVVGENLPFVGSASANAALSNQVFNSVDRQNVGITLDVVPQITEGDYVKLDLYEEVSNVVSGTENNTYGPTTTIRSASTVVFVEDHRTAVISGLISSQTTNDNQGIPFLSSIPVLGNLLSSKNGDRQKDNLLVFLTPHIIRNKADLRALALDERAKFTSSIGRPELKNMPASQVKALYAPTFSIPVAPAQAFAGAAVSTEPAESNPLAPDGGAIPESTYELPTIR